MIDITQGLLDAASGRAGRDLRSCTGSRRVPFGRPRLDPVPPRAGFSRAPRRTQTPDTERMAGGDSRAGIFGWANAGVRSGG